MTSIASREEWLTFANAAWSAAGRPDGLNPLSLESDPTAYDVSYYGYFERRFLDLWLNVYNRVKPGGGTLIRGETPDFLEAWRRNFSWGTIWKQLLPLFVYGEVVGANNDVLVELASHYCIGQAIPSVVIDRLLDEPAVGSSDNGDAAFSIVCYIKGVSGIRLSEFRFSAEIENCFHAHTRAMYGLMLVEHARRFVLPLPSLSELISDYFTPKSRLSSSVFFGILPRWAYLLAGKEPTSVLNESFDALRSVRQLNDEIADVYGDLARGLITLPWLYALEQAPDLRELIELYWRHLDSAEARHACRTRLSATKAMQRACCSSLDLLSRSMNATIGTFPASRCFGVTLLHNVRWAHVMRMQQNDYEDITPPRQPSLPNRTLSSTSSPIVPVAGSGILLTSDAGVVLMSLVLKRGMLRWELPAGVAKPGESMEEAARREAFEETGYKVEIDDAVALCWHYSHELGKGWMGVFFRAHLSDPNALASLKAIRAADLEYVRLNFVEHSELYECFALDTYNFEALRRHWVKEAMRPTAHENVLASGFVEWMRIPQTRIHPLHLKLLEAHQAGKKIELLCKDADADQKTYDPDAPLYFP